MLHGTWEAQDAPISLAVEIPLVPISGQTGCADLSLEESHQIVRWYDGERELDLRLAGRSHLQELTAVREWSSKEVAVAMHFDSRSEGSSLTPLIIPEKDHQPVFRQDCRQLISDCIHKQPDGTVLLSLCWLAL